LEVDPLPLRHREQDGSCLRTKVPNDNTRHKNGQFEGRRRWGNSPNEQCEDDDGSEKVIDQKEDRVGLGRVGMRLLIRPGDACRDTYDVNPSIEGDNPKEDEKRCTEGIKGECG
jgi:hypothetical protein